MTKPIGPTDTLLYKKTKLIDDAVFEAWNNCIARHYHNGRSKFALNELKSEIRKLTHVEDVDEMMNRGWLDLEDVYREEGWSVTFDKAAYNESYDSFFLFRVK